MAISQANPSERQVGNISVEFNDIVELRLAERLRSHGLLAGQEIDYEHCEGVVVLRGCVHSFHEKQMAQELVRKINGVKTVINRLEVDRSKFARDVTEEIPFKTGIRQPSGVT